MLILQFLFCQFLNNFLNLIIPVLLQLFLNCCNLSIHVCFCSHLKLLPPSFLVPFQGFLDFILHIKIFFLIFIYLFLAIYLNFSNLIGLLIRQLLHSLYICISFILAPSFAILDILLTSLPIGISLFTKLVFIGSI